MKKNEEKEGEKNGENREKEEKEEKILLEKKDSNFLKMIPNIVVLFR